MQHSPEVQKLAALVTDKVAEQVTDVSKVMEALEVKALAKMNELLDNGGSAAIQLKAAQDLLDRGARTSKVQKVAMASWSISEEAAKNLAQQVAAARQVRERYAPEVGQGNWDKVERAEPAEVVDDRASA